MPGQPLRILLLNKEPVLSELIRATLQPHEDVAVVGETTLVHELANAVAVLTPDVVVCSTRGDDRFVERHPEFWVGATPARLIIAYQDGREASLWQLRPQRTALGELSAHVLLQAVRAVPRSTTKRMRCDE